MNEPQFQIYGMERKKVKRKLSQLKSYVRNFWHYHQLDKDMASIYGGNGSYPMNDELAKKKFDKANDEIKTIEVQLAQRI